MIMRYKHSLMIMSKVMNKMCDDMTGKGLEYYYDAVIIHSNNREEHNKILIEFIDRCEINN